MRWPRLHDEHPGYFLVACQIVFIHLGLFGDALVNRHQQPQWHYVNQFIGFQGWAIIHLSVFGGGVFGLYRHEVIVMRTAWFISYLAFVVLAIELGIGDHVSGTSYIGAILLIGASLSSLAAFREDPVNPAMRTGSLNREGSLTKVLSQPIVSPDPEADPTPQSVDVVLNGEPPL